MICKIKYLFVNQLTLYSTVVNPFLPDHSESVDKTDLSPKSGQCLVEQLLERSIIVFLLCSFFSVRLFKLTVSVLFVDLIYAREITSHDRTRWQRQHQHQQQCLSSRHDLSRYTIISHHT